MIEKKLMKIIKLTEYHPDFLTAINHLLPQLSANAGLMNENALRKIIHSEAVTLLMALNHQQPVGMLSLVMFSTSTGNRARIEDLVVDTGMRRHGVAGRLIKSAITIAQKSDADTIELTSHPSRESANRFYEKMGFAIKKTNLYRYK